jgi:ketosteroid isomerase-like protein
MVDRTQRKPAPDAVKSALHYFVLTPGAKADYYPVRLMVRFAFHSRRFRLSVSMLALAAVSTFALPIHAAAPHPKRHDQYKHQVEKLEDAWRTAQINGDVDAMDKMLSDDYVGITMTGQVVTKSQQLERMRKRSLVLTKIDFTEVKIKIIDTTAAIVNCLTEVEGTNEGEPMHATFRSTRVYSRTPAGTWTITNFEATRVGPAPPPRGEHPVDAQKPQ